MSSEEVPAAEELQFSMSDSEYEEKEDLPEYPNEIKKALKVLEGICSGITKTYKRTSLKTDKVLRFCILLDRFQTSMDLLGSMVDTTQGVLPMSTRKAIQDMTTSVSLEFEEMSSFLSDYTHTKKKLPCKDFSFGNENSA